MTDNKLTATRESKLAPGCALWVLWAVASALGWLTGFPVADGILRLLGQFVADEVVIYALFGALPGILQWPLLRPHVPQASQWMLASTLGGILAGATITALGNAADSLLGSVVAGTLLGVLQWLVLRQHVAQAWWWLLASTVGWAVGSPVTSAADGVVSVLPLSDILSLSLLFGVFGTVYGVITGVVMAALMQRPTLRLHRHATCSVEGREGRGDNATDRPMQR